MGWLSRVLGSSSTAPLGDILDTPLCSFSKQDAFTLRDACEGVQIFGAVGSGKTSGSGATLARCYLAAGMGGLILTAKPGEYSEWQRYCAETGRSRDLVRVNPTERWRFNFLDYELRRSGAGAGLTENIVQLFMHAQEAGGRAKEGGGERFWDDTLKELLRNLVELLALATGSVSLVDMAELLDDAPTSPAQLADASWQRASTCAQALRLAEEAVRRNPAKRGDFEQTARYWTKRFPQLAEKTRSIVVTSFSSLADGLLRDPMRTLFCTETNLTPEASFRGAVIVLDLAVKEYGDVGAYAQCLFKLCWQKAVERRDVRAYPVPVFLWIDESQNFVTSYEPQFLSTSRSSRTCTVFLTQNLPNYYAAFKDKRGEHQANSVLGNLSTKIWHANGCTVTNEAAAKTIGQTWQLRSGTSAGQSSGSSASDNFSHGQGGDSFGDSASTNEGSSLNSSMNEQLAFQILPIAFTRLRQGGAPNGYAVDGIVFKAGRVWKATGTNYLTATFKQR
ncbi:MAG: type IV secretory system conjugative DNA transfer family protein [Polyangiaceae bacterium]